MALAYFPIFPCHQFSNHLLPRSWISSQTIGLSQLVYELVFNYTSGHFAFQGKWKTGHIAQSSAHKYDLSSPTERVFLPHIRFYKSLITIHGEETHPTHWNLSYIQCVCHMLYNICKHFKIVVVLEKCIRVRQLEKEPLPFKVIKWTHPTRAEL